MVTNMASTSPQMERERDNENKNDVKRRWREAYEREALSSIVPDVAYFT